jgi:fermentation-respiration switch protein FrsA (DUF1100 family)
MKNNRLLLALLLFWWVMPACNGFFYQPSRRLHSWPDQPFREVTLEVRDGVELNGWLFRPKGKLRGTFVQFHGNAGNVSTHYRSLAWVTAYGYQLFTFDYRGYGKSSGYPHPQGVREDALAALAFAATLPKGALQRDLILYGQSLGGAVLLDAYARMEDRQRVRLVIVEGAFHSYQEVAASALWRRPLLFPFTGLAYATLSDAHAAAPSVAKVWPTPLLVIHGAEDEIVPPVFGHSIYALAQPPRSLWIVPGGRHIDSMQRPAYRARLLAVVESFMPRIRRAPNSGSPTVFQDRLEHGPELDRARGTRERGSD